MADRNLDCADDFRLNKKREKALTIRLTAAPEGIRIANIQQFTLTVSQCCSDCSGSGMNRELGMNTNHNGRLKLLRTLVQYLQSY